MIDIRRVGALLRRRWPVIAAVSAAVIVLTVFAYYNARRIYSATAQVALDRRDDDLAKTSAPAELATDSPSVDTEVQVLGSPALAARVVDKLGLTRDPEYAGQTTTPAAARSAAINVLIGRLKIKRSGLSYAIGVTADSASPTQATRVVNGVVDQYVASRLDAKEADRRREVGLLRTRIAQLRGEVIAAEAAMARYRAAHGLVDVSPTGTAASQETLALNGQLAQAQAEQAAAQARLGTARAQLARGRSGQELGAALNSEVVQQLRGQQAQLSAQRADLAGRYGPLHPDLARIDRQLADIDSRIQAEVTRILSNLETEARVAGGRTSSLQGSINRGEGQLQAENAASVELNELQRNADSARSLYQAFLDRYRSAVAGQGTDQSTAHVIAHALPPLSPSSPNALVYTILALVGALLASALAVALLEMLEGGIQTSDEMEQELGVPALGMVPDLATIPGSGVTRRDPTVPSDYMIEHPSSLFAEAFRGVRTSVRRSPGNEHVKVIAITSALPDEGKTTLAICLARSAAIAGQRVILVDADLRQRASSRKLTADTRHGLAEVLSGTVPLEQALVVDSASGAMLLPQASSSDNLDLLESNAMQQLLDRLRNSYDLILLDCAPVLPVAEARQAAALADRVIVAVRWRSTPKKAIEHALRLLDQVGAVVIGAVMTRADLKVLAKSGYGDPAYFYKSYRKYYAT